MALFEDVKMKRKKNDFQKGPKKMRQRADGEKETNTLALTVQLL